MKICAEIETLNEGLETLLQWKSQSADRIKMLTKKNKNTLKTEKHYLLKDKIYKTRIIKTRIIKTRIIQRTKFSKNIC